MNIVENAIRVLKFGGTSLKNPQRLAHVAQIVADVSATAKVIVVVSAMGHTTDSLVRLASSCSATPSARELDVLLASGEQQSIALLSIVLNDLGVRVRSFTGAQLGIVTEANYGNADIVSIDSDKIRGAFIEHDVIVVAGFQGVTTAGNITTLGRGGSDTSAVALAAAAGAEFCEIYTDVDGIFTVDPNIITGAMQHQRISYENCLEMAALGAQVIHPRAVECARENSIAVRVRSVFNPTNLGTLIDDGDSCSTGDTGIVGIACSEGFSLINVTANHSLLDTKQLDDVVRGAVGALNLIEKVSRDSNTCTASYLISNLNEPAGEKLVATLGQIAGVEEARIKFDIARVSIVGQAVHALNLDQEPFDAVWGTTAGKELLLVIGELSVSAYVNGAGARTIWDRLHEALKPMFVNSASSVLQRFQPPYYVHGEPTAIGA